MNAPLVSDTAERTRAAIIDRAFDLFAHYGYTKTNIGDIAEQCGMSPGNLYRYFKNKQAIGHAVVDAFMTEEARETAALLTAPPDSTAPRPHEGRLRAHVALLVMRSVDRLRETPRIVELAEMISATEEGLEVVRPHLERRSKELAAILEAGRAAGEFAFAHTAQTTWAVELTTRFFHMPTAVTRHGLDRIDQDLESALDLICAGLRAR